MRDVFMWLGFSAAVVAVAILGTAAFAALGIPVA